MEGLGRGADGLKMKVKISKTCIGIILLAVFGWFLFQVLKYRADETGYQIVKTKMEMRQILSALEMYRSLYEKYPSGNASDILAALRGNNPKKIVFITDVGPWNTNSNGEFIDPWKTPSKLFLILQIVLPFGPLERIRSSATTTILRQAIWKETNGAHHRQRQVNPGGVAVFA